MQIAMVLESLCIRSAFQLFARVNYNQRPRPVALLRDQAYDSMQVWWAFFS